MKFPFHFTVEGPEATSFEEFLRDYPTLFAKEFTLQARRFCTTPLRRATFSQAVAEAMMEFPKGEARLAEAQAVVNEVFYPKTEENDPTPPEVVLTPEAEPAPVSKSKGKRGK